MTAFALIPGAWLGGQAWEAVADELRAAGAAVRPITLPGLGERSAEASPTLDIRSYVDDAVTQLESSELADVTLVGHSFGGAVAAGVVDRVPARVGRVVYVDSGPMPSGASYLDLLEAPQLEFVDELIRERGSGWLIPLPTWEEFETRFPASLAGLGPDEQARFRAQARPQPAGTWRGRLVRENVDATRSVPKTLISSSFPLAVVRQLIAEGHPWFAELGTPEWSFEELPTGHWPMFSRPEELARLLLRAAAAPSRPPATDAGAAAAR